MGRPLLGDKPLTAAERNKRYRQKQRGIVHPMPYQSAEPSAEELLQREILALRRENERLRAEVGLPAPAPLRDASASASVITDEEVEARYGPIWAAIKRAERLRMAGKPL